MTGEKKMKFAIVESGGKQYRAVEGMTMDVDRLSAEEGKQIDVERVLFVANGDEFLVGTPTVSGIQVMATVVEHFRGEKVFRFKYSPKKRIRVRGGHRQQYTRLLVDFIGKPGEAPKKAEAKEKPVKEKQAAVKKEAGKSSAKKAAAKKPAGKATASKSAAKKSAVKKK
jgi:large subunit ribosomal protein L21